MASQRPSSESAGYCRQTSGSIPPKLIGSSITVIGNHAYLFGGRLVTGSKVVSDLYVFDLESFKWDKVVSSEDDTPPARCFHSADAWNDQLIIFGGFGSYQGPVGAEETCLLDDVQIFDTVSGRWIPSHVLNSGLADLVQIPNARHSHLSAVTADRLFIIGGEDASNIWLDDIFVYDLGDKAWVQQCHYPRHCGTYFSVAACAELCVRIHAERTHPTSDASNSSLIFGRLPSSPGRSRTSRSSSPVSMVPSQLSLSPAYLDQRLPLPSMLEDFSNAPLSHLPYSTKPTDDFPCDVYLYSNYNSTDVKRKLEVFSPLPSADFTIQDQSPNPKADPSPPFLRFPTGAVVGTHFIVAGTYLGPTSQFFSIWALDLLTMTWSHIDTGRDVAYGSWFQGCLWREGGKFIMFGDRNGSIANDYSQRLSSWEHIAIVDLETFGIYQPPTLELDLATQELCLTALEEAVESDFELISDEGQRIKCSRKLLETRWPWFNRQVTRLLERAKSALETTPASALSARRLKDTLGVEDTQPDPRITSRAFDLGESYPVTMALLQYFYTLSLSTPLQQAPAVLCRLLELATTYDIPRLQALVKHAMHRTLSESTCDGIFEAATQANCQSLQLRAFKTVLSYRQRGAPSRLGNRRRPHEIASLANPAPEQLEVPKTIRTQQYTLSPTHDRLPTTIEVPEPQMSHRQQMQGSKSPYNSPPALPYNIHQSQQTSYRNQPEQPPYNHPPQEPSYMTSPQSAYPNQMQYYPQQAEQPPHMNQSPHAQYNNTQPRHIQQGPYFTHPHAAVPEMHSSPDLHSNDNVVASGTVSSPPPPPSSLQSSSVPSLDAIPVTKPSKSKRFFGKVFRNPSASARPDSPSISANHKSNPGEKKKPKVMGGGGGRHPVPLSAASKAARIRAIEAAVGGSTYNDKLPSNLAPKSPSSDTSSQSGPTDRPRNSVDRGHVSPDPGPFQSPPPSVMDISTSRAPANNWQRTGTPDQSSVYNYARDAGAYYPPSYAQEPPSSIQTRMFSPPPHSGRGTATDYYRTFI